MHTFTTFTHRTFGTTRALLIDGQPYFAATDVCRALNLAVKRDSLDSLTPSDCIHIEVRGALGYVITLSGSYTLAFDSPNPNARDYVGWLNTFVSTALRDAPDKVSTESAPTVHNTEAAVIDIVGAPQESSTSQVVPVNKFTHPEFGQLEVNVIDGKEYFLAVECAKILGYKKPHDAIASHCPHSVKRGVGVQTGIKADGTPAMQTVEKSFIPEGDLYRLIIRSKLPAAEKFERWVFDEVLPSIRKHGAYMTAPVLQQVMNNPSSIIDLANALIEEHKKSAELRQQVAQQNTLIETQSAVIEEMRPKVSYLDTILQNEKTIPVSIIAKDYGMSAVSFNKMLHDLRIQYKCGKTWLLYSQYSHEGYTSSYLAENAGEYVGVQTNWTQKGRLFLYNILKERLSIVPIIERESA